MTALRAVLGRIPDRQHNVSKQHSLHREYPRVADRFRKTLRGAGTTPIIPGRSNRKRRIRYDERRYRDRWLIEAMLCRLKDFHRVATRYDKLAANFLSAAALAAVVAFWT